MGPVFSIKLQDMLTALFFPPNTNSLKLDSFKENSNQFFYKFQAFFLFSVLSQGLLLSFVGRTDTQTGYNNNDYFDSNIKFLGDL